MDSPNAFDTINYELLIAKLYAYGFPKDALKMNFSYMSDRWQRSKINKSFSSWSALPQGVPQGSALVPALFYIYLNGLFYFLRCDVCNFADDTTRYVCGKNLDLVLTKLEDHSTTAIEWFENNNMKVNSDKCHLFISGNKFEHLWAEIGNSIIWENRTGKLLAITIDHELKFDKHQSIVCLKVNRMLSALTRIRKCQHFKQIRIRLRDFLMPNSNTAPLRGCFIVEVETEE